MKPSRSLREQLFRAALSSFSLHSFPGLSMTSCPIQHVRSLLQYLMKPPLALHMARGAATFCLWDILLSHTVSSVKEGNASFNCICHTQKVPKSWSWHECVASELFLSGSATWENVQGHKRQGSCLLFSITKRIRCKQNKTSSALKSP